MPVIMELENVRIDTELCWFEEHINIPVEEREIFWRMFYSKETIDDKTIVKQSLDIELYEKKDEANILGNMKTVFFAQLSLNGTAVDKDTIADMGMLQVEHAKLLYKVNQRNKNGFSHTFLTSVTKEDIMQFVEKYFD